MLDIPRIFSPLPRSPSQTTGGGAEDGEAATPGDRDGVQGRAGTRAQGQRKTTEAALTESVERRRHCQRRGPPSVRNYETHIREPGE